MQCHAGGLPTPKQFCKADSLFSVPFSVCGWHDAVLGYMGTRALGNSQMSEMPLGNSQAGRDAT